VLDKAEYSAFESTLNSSIVSYRNYQSRRIYDNGNGMHFKSFIVTLYGLTHYRFLQPTTGVLWRLLHWWMHYCAL